jgi:hypothetical protein
LLGLVGGWVGGACGFGVMRMERFGDEWIDGWVRVITKEDGILQMTHVEITPGRLNSGMEFFQLKIKG